MATKVRCATHGWRKPNCCQSANAKITIGTAAPQMQPQNTSRKKCAWKYIRPNAATWAEAAAANTSSGDRTPPTLAARHTVAPAPAAAAASPLQNDSYGASLSAIYFESVASR